MADGTHVELGHAMITLVEPTTDPERLAEYNRGYEHDHAYSGVMVGPWAFSEQRGQGAVHPLIIMGSHREKRRVPEAVQKQCRSATGGGAVLPLSKRLGKPR